MTIIVGVVEKIQTKDREGNQLITKTNKPYIRVSIKGSEEKNTWQYNYFGKADFQEGDTVELEYDMDKTGQFRNISNIKKLLKLSPEEIKSKSQIDTNTAISNQLEGLDNELKEIKDILKILIENINMLLDETIYKTTEKRKEDVKQFM